MGCWRGYLSGPWGKVTQGAGMDGQADATATHCLLLLNADWFWYGANGSRG